MRAICGVGLAVGRQPSKLIYTGSIPVPRFSDVRLLGQSTKAGVAQLVEHLICNQRVGGSSPSASSKNLFVLSLLAMILRLVQLEELR